MPSFGNFLAGYGTTFSAARKGKIFFQELFNCKRPPQLPRQQNRSGPERIPVDRHRGRTQPVRWVRIQELLP